jgi:hypothetical protein
MPPWRATQALWRLIADGKDGLFDQRIEFRWRMLASARLAT